MSQSEKDNNRRWEIHEDEALVASMVELYNTGTHNADNGFKAGYLLELERMLRQKLSNSSLKATPHIVSRIKTLKKDWGVVYDMIRGMNTSGFGWDDSRKMVVAEPHVWNAYISSHKGAAIWRKKSFPYFEDLSMIYGKDRATGADAQVAEDIIAELQRNEPENEQWSVNDVPEVGIEDLLVDNDSPGQNVPHVSTPTQSGTSKGRKRKASADMTKIADSIIHAADSLTTNIGKLGEMLSKSLENNTKEEATQLYNMLAEIRSLSTNERNAAYMKCMRDQTLMMCLLSIPPDQRLEFIKQFVL